MKSATATAVASSVIPTPAELYQRARSLVPMLAERASSFSAETRIPADVVDAMKALGLFRILQPKKWGGYELSPSVFYEVQTILAEGDMSAAWVFGILGVHNWHLALFDARLAAEVWADDEDVLVASTYMPVGKVEEVEGGFKLSGRWKFSSGCDNADWILLGAMLPDGKGGVEPGTLAVPLADLRIVEDSWQVNGLRGTGSKDIVVEGAFVPAYRTHRHRQGFLCDSPGMKVFSAPLYKLPFGQVFIRAVNSSCIGALQGFASAVADYAAKRVSPFGGKAAENQSVQVSIAEALSAVSEMKAVLHRNFAAMEGYIERGETPPTSERVLYKYQAAHVASRAADAANKLYRVVGGMGLFSDTPFPRMLNDILAARQHAFNQDYSFACNLGSIAIGRENSDFFI